VTYNGNTSVTAADIGNGVSVSVDVPGANTTGSGPRGLVTDSRTGADFFNHLISLQNHLLANDTASIASTDRPALSKDEDNILFQVSNNGASQTRLDAAASAANATSTSIDKQISNKADADLTDTIVKLNQAQNSYQAALQSSAKILQMSLMNYLQ
jgi:flagellar hook-associated protein 3 FlgL